MAGDRRALPRGVPAILVGIDTTPLRQTRAGTARYLRGLLANLELPLAEVSFPAGSRLGAVAADLLWYPRLAVEDVDLLHCPTFRGPFASRVPLVVTVHDLAVLRHPQWFNRWTRSYSRHAVPRVLRAARRVIAVSEFTRRELIELLGVPAAKIRVVPNAVEEVFTPQGPRAEGDYVLAVGTLEPRKNLARIAAAVEGELRVVGARGWGGVEPPANVRWLGEVGDEELARLYRGARCLVYASLYEGFGIPVAEALACGCPVVTSAESPMAELAGGDATVVDPYDVGSIRARDRARLRAHAAAGRLLGRGRAGDPRALRGGRVILLDADVLGRQRTGDETYVSNLLRELPRAAPDLRFGAVTRHPELVPEGVEPIVLPARFQEARMALSLPRLLRRLRPGLAHFQHALPLGFRGRTVVTVHDLSFERDRRVDGPRSTGSIFRAVVPRAARRADRVIAVSERTRRDIVVELYGVPDENRR